MLPGARADRTGFPPQELLDYFVSKTPSATLANEIDADLVALEYTSFFISEKFKVSPETAVNACLRAFEAQSFLQSVKDGCALLKKYAGQIDIEGRLSLDHWLQNTLISVCARCILRRAAFVLAGWTDPEARTIAEKVNAYVPVVDAMFLDSVAFRADATKAYYDAFNTLLKRIPAESDKQYEMFFSSLIEEMRESGAVRLDLFYILIAMGFPGGTDTMWYFERHLKKNSNTI